MRLLILSISIVLCIISCTKEDENTNYLEINGRSFPLRYGYIEDNKTDVNIKYRIFDIEFRDKEINPSTYFQFRIFSNSTIKLEVGNYQYSYSPTKKGEFSLLSMGTNIVYDNLNVRIYGNVYNDNYWEFQGNIIIGLTKYNNYTFDISLKGYNLESNDSIEVIGHFEKPLINDIVILDGE